MRPWLLTANLLMLALAGCASALAAPASSAAPGTPGLGKPSSLPDLGPAPELAGDTWLNTPSALRLSDLRGKVVLLDMWTFGCINCRHVIPSLRDWYEKYAVQGLVVIGNHYPEFGYESQLANLRQAVTDLDVTYPVVQDNDGVNWSAYKTLYWPTMYLIDKTGRIRYVHIGEGGYAQTERAIQSLLAE